MPDKSTFGEEVQSYLTGKMVRDKRTGKRVEATQKRLAQEISIRAETLSRKLKDSQRLTDNDVHLIGETLVWWGLIPYHTQLQHLFEHVGYTLPGDDWRREPWKTLIDDTQPPEGAVLPLQNASFENQKDDLRVKSQVPPETPKLHNIRFQRNPFFTGREAPLKQLRQQLQENGSVAINQPISISGLGGVGKTQLALEYAYQSYQAVYKAVFWVDAATKEMLQSGYKDLADLLELPSDPDKCIQAVKVWLEGHTNWLLILDNADDLPLVRSFLPIKRSGHIVVTTRSQVISTLGTKTAHIEIQEMEPIEGLLFLLRRVGIAQDKASIATVAADVRKAASQLVQLLGGHPLALDQAGAYVEEASVSFADYIRLYQEARQSLLARRGSEANKHGNHPESVAATLALSFSKACERHPLAADILYFCSFLEPDAMSEELVRLADGRTFDPMQFNEAIFALRGYSLIKRNTEEKFLSMHRLVQDVLINAMSLDVRKQWFLCVQQTLSNADQEEAFGGKKGPQKFIQAFVEKRARKKQGRDLPSHARIALSRANATHKGVYPGGTAPFLAGYPMFSSEEREHSKREYEEERKQNALKQKEAEYQRLLSYAEKRYGAEHPGIASPLNVLAEFYVEQGKYEQAEPLCERAAAIPDVAGAAIDIALAFRELAKLSQRLGKLDRAATFSQRSFRMLERRLGTYDPYYTQLIRKNCAEFLRSIGHDAEAQAVESSQELIIGPYPELTNIEYQLLALDFMELGGTFPVD